MEKTFTFNVPTANLQNMSIDELEQAIQHHNHLYWDLNQPEISDYEFDRLVEQLKTLRPDSPVLQEMGPSEIGRTGVVVTHSVSMLSLDKCYTDEDLLSWADKFEGEVVVMPKMDGIAMSLRYDDRGHLTVAATRGSGLEGDEVTANARTIREIPNQVQDRNVEVRGEIYMRLSIFADFADRFSNPRNLAAGAIKHKNPARCRDYRLSFVAYDILGTPQTTEQTKFSHLESMGFQVTPYQLVDKALLRQAYEYFATLRNSLDYEIDGVVFKANEIAEQRRLGATAHHPRYAIAYKFQGDSGVTTLKKVEWSVARSGVITPVAHIEPVTLSGASVSRASLHNAGFLNKLGLLGKPAGAKVVVTRRGGVIPKVEFVTESAPESGATIDELITYPLRCPSCGEPVRQEGDFIYCVKPENCRDVQIGALAHYCAVLDILGFGEKLLTQAYEQKILRSPADLYTLREEDLHRLERVGPKLAAKLIKEVQDHRQVDLSTFLRALGIDELGRHVAELLEQKYLTLDKVRQANAQELSAIHSIGTEIATHVVAGLQEKSAFIDRLLEHVVIVPRSTATAADKKPLTGQSFVFTGTLLAFDRKTAQQKVTALGGEVPAGVTKSLTYLVIGDEAEEQSNKRTKAEKYRAEGAHIRIIGEIEFLKLIGEKDRKS